MYSTEKVIQVANKINENVIQVIKLTNKSNSSTKVNEQVI